MKPFGGTKAALPIVQPTPPVCPDREAQTCVNSGKQYFWRRGSQRVQWEDPSVFGDIRVNDGAAVKAAHAAGVDPGEAIVEDEPRVGGERRHRKQHRQSRRARHCDRGPAGKTRLAGPRATEVPRAARARPRRRAAAQM